MKKINHLWKNRKALVVLLGIECLLLLFCLPGLWAEQTTYSVPKEQFQDAATEKTNILLPSLQSGIYRISVDYQAVEGSRSVLRADNENHIYKGSYSNELVLSGSSNRVTMTLWMSRASEDVWLKISPAEEAKLTINSIQVVKTNQGAVVAMLCLLLLSVAADVGLLLWYRLREQSKQDAGSAVQNPGRLEGKRIWALLGIFIVTALPVFTDYCLQGAQLNYYLLRIEGLKDGQLYASSVFEGNLFLFIPALLRAAAFPVQTAYKLYLLLLCGASTGIAYYCFGGIFQDKKWGLLGSMLYLWTPYNLDVLYGKADLAEATALCFLPMVFYGFYRMINEDTEEKGFWLTWILPAVGLGGMLQSHFSSFVLAAGMVLLFCLFWWKSFLAGKRIWNLIKLMLAVLVLNAWKLFWVLKSQLYGEPSVKYAGALPVQGKGGTLLHYLMTFFRNGDSRNFDNGRITDTAPLGVGFVVICLLLVYLWIVFTGRYKENRQTQSLWKMTKVSAIVGGIFLLMSTSHFPWDALRGRLRLVQVATAGLESPMELVPMVSICFIYVGCMVLWQIRKSEQANIVACLLAAVVLTAFVTTQFLTGDMLRSREAVRIYDAAALELPVDNVENPLCGGEIYFLPHRQVLCIFTPDILCQKLTILFRRCFFLSPYGAAPE